MSGKRSLGSFASARSSTDSVAGGNHGTSVLGAGGGSVICIRITATGVGAWNGALPTSIS
jgi:hypothetical protein